MGDGSHRVRSGGTTKVPTRTRDAPAGDDDPGRLVHGEVEQSHVLFRHQQEEPRCRVRRRREIHAQQLPPIAVIQPPGFPRRDEAERIHPRSRVLDQTHSLVRAPFREEQVEQLPDRPVDPAGNRETPEDPLFEPVKDVTPQPLRHQAHPDQQADGQDGADQGGGHAAQTPTQQAAGQELHRHRKKTPVMRNNSQRM